MSKANLIEFWRELILSDEALEQYKANRTGAVMCHDLTNEERRSILDEDYAAIYRAGVPVELMFQVVILAGIHPRDYMRKLHVSLGYRGRGMLTAEEALKAAGNFTPSS
jgi:imidazolonepropionase-like amidohydrolase